MNIGDWVRRKRSGAKWHLVESVVADAAVVRCGPRMEPKDRDGQRLDVSDVMPLTRMPGQPQLCKKCDA